MSNFKFELSETVKLKHSGETGEVRGRGEYVDGESSYLIAYKAADGRQVQSWWDEALIEKTPF